MKILNSHKRDLLPNARRIIAAAAFGVLAVMSASAQASDSASTVYVTEAAQDSRLNAGRLAPTGLTIDINLGHARIHHHGGRRYSNPRARHYSHRNYDRHHGHGHRSHRHHRGGDSRHRFPRREHSPYRHGRH